MPYVLIPVVVSFLVLVWLILEYSIFIPVPKGIPILMYHKVSDGTLDGITISSEKLKKQFDYIKQKGYQTVSFKEITAAIKTGSPLPEKPVILTFDDAYRNFMTRAFPLLKSYGFKATVFIPVGFIGKTNAWDNGTDPILMVEEINELANSEIIEFGLHSFLHRNYPEMDPAGIQNDLDLCIQTLGYHKIPFVRVLAYPYGSFPKKDPELNIRMKEIFRSSGLLFALRIGNRINRWPFRDPFELKRIDIRGTDDFYTFRTKLLKGRRKVLS
ncbi:MAG: polysaccharide deacetylase family protein [Bacteroidetes bacterium]|nr:polysaccharide deacetylase family protein [Bacteroidota bacterium]